MKQTRIFRIALYISAIVSLTIVGFCAQASPPVKPIQPASAPVDFDRDVRPIISENCFKCHGFDEKQRQAGLRLDTPVGAYQKLASGNIAIVGGKLKESALIARISDSGSLHMPPVSSGKKITPQQVAILRRWVAQGGKYARHWSFVAPRRPNLPLVKNSAWPHNPIDRFILARLEKEGLIPSPQADKATLLRRVTFDLTGLPPTPVELDAFLADSSPNSYEKQVDRLLANPHYGERMALAWLDLARYADTHGYHIDSQRDMWRWREWVIDAFNQNLPFDQFTIQQIAGDLLPKPTLSQRIATGFNRNHPIDFEGGAIPEEYAAAYIFDRIDTTSTTWLGLTMRCAQCHDHKYDPITQKDFYRFYAFFNNVPELGLDGQTGNAVPFLKAPSPQQQEQLDAFKKQTAELDLAAKNRAAEAMPAFAVWEKQAASNADKQLLSSTGLIADYACNETTGDQLHDVTGKQPVALVKGKPQWATGMSGSALNLDGTTFADLGTGFNFERTDKFSYGAWVNPSAGSAMTVISKMDDANANRGWDLYISEGKVYVHIIHSWDKNVVRVNTKAAIEQKKWTHLFVTYDGSSKAKGIRVYINGKPAEVDISHDSLTDTIQTPVNALIGRRTPAAPFIGLIDDVRVYNRELNPGEVEQIANWEALRQILATASDKRTPEQKSALSKYFLENQDQPYMQLNSNLMTVRGKLAELDKMIPTTMVMQDMDKPRDTFMLIRGQYDKKGEKVSAALPAFLMLPENASSEPAKPVKAIVDFRLSISDLNSTIDNQHSTILTRLELAKWLVAPTNPLTARVAVNRYWQMYFGIGIVKTAEDFGTQGERPVNPELLDWLATEFARTGWDVKAMQRLIVTSASYRQSSRTTNALIERDPDNRLLARGPRYRLPAEFIRDQALSVSGLLVNKIGGPSVKPYQPPGLWEEISFGGGFSAQTYEQGHGEDLYRRSMYTFWKRTSPPPMLQLFDAPEREFCMVRRSITNTPLQALALMNDPTYVEAARKFAERIIKEGGSTTQDRLRFATRQVLLRSPKESESRILLKNYNQQLAKFRNDNAAALKLLSVGESKRDEKLDVAEFAAWTAVANILLNLDESITKN